MAEETATLFHFLYSRFVCLMSGWLVFEVANSPLNVLTLNLHIDNRKSVDLAVGCYGKFGERRRRKVSQIEILQIG